MNWYKQAQLKKKVLNVEKFDGYEVRTEDTQVGNDEDGRVEMESAYADSGCYIGDVETAKMLIEEKGIAPEASCDDHDVCSIGFEEESQNWWGWSHRAMSNFGIGDEPVAATPSGNETQYDGPAKTLDQAKQYAIEFADSVS